MKAPTRSYYLTDRAYNTLLGMAMRQRFVPFGSSRAKGISEFLNQLALHSFEDTRPPNVLQRHKEEIAHNRAPNWSHNRNRKQRLLNLTEDAVARYFKIAWQVEIVRATPYVIGGPPKFPPYSAVGHVLEGIGLEWLTPRDMPYGTR